MMSVGLFGQLAEVPAKQMPWGQLKRDQLPHSLLSTESHNIFRVLPDNGFSPLFEDIRQNGRDLDLLCGVQRFSIHVNLSCSGRSLHSQPL